MKVIRRHLEPTLLLRTFVRLTVDGDASHSDIDLLVTVTVGLMKQRASTINDLLETSASHGRARFSAL